MSDFRATSPPPGVTVLPRFAHASEPAARLLPVSIAHAQHAADLAALARRADPAVAMTFSLAWARALPPPARHAGRLLLLYDRGRLCAALSLRERTVLGLPSGFLHGGDAKGEGLVLAARGEEDEWFTAGLLTFLRSRRCAALLLTRSAGCGGLMEAAGKRLKAAGFQVGTHPVPLHWQTRLCAGFDETLRPLGHRTRRNLRHAQRRVTQNGWRFLSQLTPLQAVEATTALAGRSTHPYNGSVVAARLALENGQPNGFSMGIRDAQGEWLSMLTGARRPGGITDIFWQANAAQAHDSLALSMRALLMEHEGANGQRVLRFIGGTAPLLEHCCPADAGTQMIVTRPGLRLSLLRFALRTPVASATNPLRRMLSD